MYTEQADKTGINYSRTVQQAVIEMVGLPEENDHWEKAAFSIFTGMMEYTGRRITEMTEETPSLEQICKALSDPASALFEEGKTFLKQSLSQYEYKTSTSILALLMRYLSKAKEGCAAAQAGEAGGFASEAERFGAFVEDALSEEDAADSGKGLVDGTVPAGEEGEP